MSRDIYPRTNGDKIAPAVDGMKKTVARAASWAREHPDEIAVTAAPWLLLTLATRRHPLTFAEAFAVTQAAYWGGVALCGQYQQWKTRPARPSLRDVT